MNNLPIGINIARQIEKEYDECKGYCKKIINAPLHSQRYLILNILYYMEYNKDFDINVNSYVQKKKTFLTNLENYLKLKSIDHYKMIDRTVDFLRSYLMISIDDKKNYGEIFTPYSIINEKLDYYSEHYNDWTPESKFLFPANGIGNYAVHVIKRLMTSDTMISFLPDYMDRYKYIIENQIYICELQEKNLFMYLFAIDPKSKFKHNIYNGDFLSTGFNKHCKEIWGIDKFTCTFEHPPYLKTNDDPIYNLFVDKSIQLSTKVMFLIPSKWFAAGKGKMLENFKNRIIEMSHHIPLIRHFDKYNHTFKSSYSKYKMYEDEGEQKKVKIKLEGGFCYMLYDENYIGQTNFNGSETLLKKHDIIMTKPEYSDIVLKIQSIDRVYLDSIYQSDGASVFGIKTNCKHLHRERINSDQLPCYVSLLRGGVNYIDREHIRRIDRANSYKVITPGMNGGGGFGKIYVSGPGEVMSQTYIYFEVGTEAEAESLKSYLETKFAHVMLMLRKISQHISRVTIKWIPIVPFDRIWTDDMLYQYFDLSEDEIKLIEAYR